MSLHSIRNTAANVSNISETAKKNRKFLVKKEGPLTGAPQNSEGDFTCLDVVASKFAITIPQVYVLTSNNAIRLRWFFASPGFALLR